jgi:hypothetical protein
VLLWIYDLPARGDIYRFKSVPGLLDHPVYRAIQDTISKLSYIVYQAIQDTINKFSYPVYRAIQDIIISEIL